MITGALVRLRPASLDDRGPFADILAHPDVARWWGPVEGVPAQVRELLAPPAGTETFAVVVDGETVGLAQCAEEPDPMYRHAGIDIAVHPDRHRRGIGTDAVRALARHLVGERGHHRLVIDPAAANEIAIRTYRRVGFRPVGVMRRYERAPDGTWRDGLLMDLLAGELI